MLQSNRIYPSIDLYNTQQIHHAFPSADWISSELLGRIFLSDVETKYKKRIEQYKTICPVFIL